MPLRHFRLYIAALIAVGCSEPVLFRAPLAEEGGVPDASPTVDSPPSPESSTDSGLDHGDRDVIVPPSLESGPVDASPEAPLDGPHPEAPADGPHVGPVPRFSRIGKYATTIEASRDPADVYYPDPPDLRTRNYAFPVVLLLQGAKVARQFYSGVSAAVAGYGFVVVVPDHLSDNIGGRGLYAELREIADVIAQMKTEAASSTSPLRGVVDTTRILLMGHSYGGASGLSGIGNTCFPPLPLCTFQRPPELSGGAFYGTHLVALGAAPNLDTGGLPVLLVEGDRDGKALPADAQRTYDQIQKRPKALLSLKGANHYGVTDVDNPPGADVEVTTQTLDHAAGVASAGRWIGVFFAAFVLGDADARMVLRAAPAWDPNVALQLAE